MKNSKIILIICLTLTGCYQSLNQTDVRKAVEYCNGVENIEYIDAYFSGDEYVKCLNGNKTSIGLFKL